MDPLWLILIVPICFLQGVAVAVYLCERQGHYRCSECRTTPTPESEAKG